MMNKGISLFLTQDEKKSFISIVKKLCENNMINPEVEPSPDSTVGPVDWNNHELKTGPQQTLTPEFLSNANLAMTEALKSENFDAGFIAAIQLVMLFRP